MVYDRDGEVGELVYNCWGRFVNLTYSFSFLHQTGMVAKNRTCGCLARSGRLTCGNTECVFQLPPMMIMTPPSCVGHKSVEIIIFHCYKVEVYNLINTCVVQNSTVI